jgi:hypothetical protein
VAENSFLISLDEPSHPLSEIITHHTLTIMSSALSLTEKHSTQIELIRRRIAAAPDPTGATRRLTFLQGIAKSTESAQKDTKIDSDDQLRRGWDTDAVEDMWIAVLTYIREMGGLLNDIAGLKDIVDRSIDKASVTLPTKDFIILMVVNILSAKTHINTPTSITNTNKFK